MSELSCSVVSGSDPPWLSQALALRHAVFVDEQGVPAELETDSHESECLQFLALVDGEAVGTGRLRRTEGGIKFERVAVARPFRERGVGAELANAMLRALGPGEPAYMHAQSQAISFWRRFGFQPEGPPFLEAGIEHQRLVLRR